MKMGKITNTNWSGNVKDVNTGSSIYHTGMISTDIYNQQGDSGAPVLLYSYSNKTGDLLGISFGGYDKGNLSIINPLKTVLDGLGVIRY